jgi:ribonuclease HI
MAMTFTLYFDGACEPAYQGGPANPGGVATAGWLIYNEQKELVAKDQRFVREGKGATNNVAEWCALGFALRWLLDNKHNDCQGQSLCIRGDSKLVCHQLTGEWKCNVPHLQKLKSRCLEILTKLGFKNVEVEWIPRAQNQEADDLSKLAHKEHVAGRGH